MNPDAHANDRIRIHDVQLLSDSWSTLKKTTFDYRRHDGGWQRQTRETYDRGNGATLLLYNLETERVILTRQFRYPAFVNEHHGFLIEAPAGLLESTSPEERIRQEVEEETGYRIAQPRKVFEAFMSPGSVTEKLHFYIAEYNAATPHSRGGGIEAEGEDIEVLELSFQQAMRMIGSGEIMDGKTIMLLQHLHLHVFCPQGVPS